jgi:pilus assembly protein CpaB
VSLRTVLVLVLALVCGASAAVGITTLRNPGPEGPKADTVPLVMAAVDIPRGTSLSVEMLKTRDCPKDLLPPGAITRIEDAVDRVTFSPLVMNESLLDNKLAEMGSGRGMAGLTTKGMRSVTIQTPNVSSGVAGFILPGNHVDVLLTVESQGQDATGGGSTVRLLQNVEILAVDQRLDAAPLDKKVDTSSSRSVTLLVTPDQDAMLALAQRKGTLHLSLRNSGDTAEADSRPVTLGDLKFFQETWRGLAASTTEGMRAITIQTSNVASGVGGFIVPGNRVDVLLTITPDGKGGMVGEKTTTLLQNLEILAVDSRVGASNGKGEAKKDKNEAKIGTKDLNYLNVTFLVTPEQAATLALAQNLVQTQELGSLYLVLRNPKDRTTTETRPVNVADLGLQREKVRQTEGGGPPPTLIRTMRGTQEGEPINLYPFGGAAGGR